MSVLAVTSSNTSRKDHEAKCYTIQVRKIIRQRVLQFCLCAQHCLRFSKVLMARWWRGMSTFEPSSQRVACESLNYFAGSRKTASMKPSSCWPVTSIQIVFHKESQAIWTDGQRIEVRLRQQIIHFARNQQIEASLNCALIISRA